MNTFRVSHLADGVLLRGLHELVARDRATTAEMIAHLAEVAARRLYAGAGCSSMFDYCLRVLRMSEDMASKRLRVAAASREFPALLDALASGALHLSGAVLLAPRLSRENAAELLAAATHQTREQIEALLAARFPQAAIATRLVPLVAVTSESVPGAMPAVPATEDGTLALPSTADASAATEASRLGASPVSDSSDSFMTIPEPVPAPGRVQVRTPPDRVQPLSASHYALHVTLSRETHDKLRRAQELLGHTVPSQDLAQVLDRALDALVAKLEKQRFAKTDSPRKRRSRANGDYIPADMKRRVAERDGHRCTFESPDGLRCESRRDLQYDHVITKARGGKTTDDNLRLRCHAHNQYEAERVFGAEFMRQKRERRGGALPRAGDAGSGGANTSPPA